MSDEYLGNASPEPEAGEPSEELLEQEPQEGAKPDPVTLDSFRQMLDERNESLVSRLQSLTDRQEDRVTKKLDKWTEALKKFDVNVTDDMINNKRLEIATAEADRAIADEDDSQSPSRQSKTQPDPEVVKATNEAMKALQKQYGYVLDRNDPEYWEVPFQDSTPQDFLAKYEAGLKDVVTRLGRPLPQQTQEQPASNPGTRTPPPSGAPFGGVESITVELNTLQNKVGRTREDNKRIAALSAELMKHIPKK